jgi:hypothetical protein
MVRRVEATLDSLRLLESLQLPLIEAGSRAARIAAALEELSRIAGPDDWFVYVGDEDSFRTMAGSGAPAPPSAGRRVDALPVFAAAAPSGPPDPFPDRRDGANTAPMAALIACGYTLPVPDEPYRNVRVLVSRLNETEAFAGVDLLPESERSARDDIVAPWNRALAALKNAGAVDRDVQYRSFALRLPFAATPITPPTR